MAQTNWPQGLLCASVDTYIDEDDDLIVHEFLQRWGGYTPTIFAHILREERHDVYFDKLFTLFALGYLAPPEATTLLIPFLQSNKRGERWASAISLGRLKEERAFQVLQDMLLKGLQDADCINDENLGTDNDWYMMRCRDIALVLGDWGSRVAVPTLRKAFALCWNRETQGDAASPDRALLWWHPLQNSIAYALGQLEAWGVISTLQLPPIHENIALIYLILGSLEHLSSSKLRENRKSLIHEHPQPILLQRDGTITASCINLEHIERILQERFGLSPEERTIYFHKVWQAHNQRRLKRANKGGIT